MRSLIQFGAEDWSHGPLIWERNDARKRRIAQLWEPEAESPPRSFGTRAGLVWGYMVECSDLGSMADSLPDRTNL